MPENRPPMLAIAIFIFISYSSSADLFEMIGARHALGENRRILQQSGKCVPGGIGMAADPLIFKPSSRSQSSAPAGVYTRQMLAIMRRRKEIGVGIHAIGHQRGGFLDIRVRSGRAFQRLFDSRWPDTAFR